MRRALQYVFILTALLVLGCADGQALDGSLGADQVEVDQGVVCCPVEEQEHCDCANLGGAMPSSGRCPVACDLDPIGWTYYVDEFGCRAIEVDGLKSCLTRLLDMGMDAGTATTATTDAGIDAGA